MASPSLAPGVLAWLQVAMRRALAVLFLAVFCAPAQILTPEARMLVRIRARVREALDRLPDCTCIETVDRSWKPAGKKLAPVDRVVLQILFSGGKELFAAPGGTRWETDPFAFLASGMMANGLFALDLKNVFLNNISDIRYHGGESPAGSLQARYDFSISRTLSGATVTQRGASGGVALRGSFWADPETYDVRRLEFHAEEIPPELFYADISTAIDYSRVRIGESDVLLPRSADLHTTAVDGEEKRDQVEFTHCQGFRTESTVHFGADAAATAAALAAAPAAGRAAAPSPPPNEGVLPPGLRVTVALHDPLGDQAPVGSLLTGKVAAAVVQKGKVLVPEGALAKGRIRRLERYSDAGDYFILALEFVQVETPSGRLRFYAEMQDVDRLPGVETMLITTNVKRGEMRWPDGARMNWSRTDRVRIWTQEVPGVGTFFVRGSHLSLPPGFKTVWKTLPYPP